MKLTVSVEGLSTLARARTANLAALLATEVDRELQASAASGQPVDADQRRAALERAIRRLSRAS